MRAPAHRIIGRTAWPQAPAPQANWRNSLASLAFLPQVWTNFVASPFRSFPQTDAIVSRAERDPAMPKPRLSASTKHLAIRPDFAEAHDSLGHDPAAARASPSSPGPIGVAQMQRFRSAKQAGFPWFSQAPSPISRSSRGKRFEQATVS